MKKVKTLNTTTDNRTYNLVNQQLIHVDKCWVCSKRRGIWSHCHNNGERDWDNPVRSWKYKSKKKKQYL